MSEIPQTRYAQHGDNYIAYQVLGVGPPDIVFMRTAFNHLELQWEEPRFARFLNRLASMGRLIVFDVLGSGLSDPFPSGVVPTIEDWADGLLAVMDTVGSEQCVLIAASVAATRAFVFTATHPDKVIALVSCNGYARLAHADDYPIGLNDEEREFGGMYDPGSWGQVSPPGLAEVDPVFAAWATKYRRYAMSPGTVRTVLGTAPDVRHVLGAIHVPTLVLVHERPSLAIVGDETMERKLAQIVRYSAEHIDGAQLATLPGRVLSEWRFDDPDAVADEIQRFIGVSPSAGEPDRVLATVLFTDIVDSTPSNVVVGDRGWSERLDALDRLVGAEVDRYRGRVIKSTGDGHLATFDGPGRAIKCSLALCHRAAELGVVLRSGLHTGEIEVRGEDIGGIAVSIARRVCDAAEAESVFVSSSVPPLVAGSPLVFDDRGEYELKGVPGRWQLYAVRS